MGLPWNPHASIKLFGTSPFRITQYTGGIVIMMCTYKNVSFGIISYKRGSNTVAVMNIISASIFFIMEFILALASDYGRDFDSAISQIEEFFLPTIIIYDFHHQKVLLIVVNLILSFLLIVNILLLFGTTKGKPMFLLPWLVFHMTSFIVSFVKMV